MKRKFIVEFEYDTGEHTLNTLDVDMLVGDAFESIADGVCQGIEDGSMSYSMSFNWEIEGTWKITEVKE